MSAVARSRSRRSRRLPSPPRPGRRPRSGGRPRSVTRLRLATHLPYRLALAAHAVSTLIAGAYEDRFDLPIAQWRVLAVLAERDDLRQQDLVPLSALDKQSVSRTVRALQRRGLVRRKLSRTDARAYALSLSAAGKRLHVRVAPLALRFERELLRALRATHGRGLQRSLMRLQGAAQSAIATRRHAALAAT